MDKWALITGASAGIGRELAGVFAERGTNLVLVARDESRLKQLAQELTRAYQVQTRVLAQDLAQPTAAAVVFERTRDLVVSTLVNNAGFGRYGAFADTELAWHTKIMQVNMSALVQLTHLFLVPMLARGEGRILNVSSTAAFQPGPMFNIYYASKAFVYSFSYALANETEGTGVSVTVLCPGMTRTEFQHRAGLRESGRWPMMTAREAALAGYNGLINRRRVVVPGVINKIGAFFTKRLPARLTSAIIRRIHQA